MVRLARGVAGGPAVHGTGLDHRLPGCLHEAEPGAHRCRARGPRGRVAATDRLDRRERRAHRGEVQPRPERGQPGLVDVAARLEQAAPAMGVYVGGTTYRLVREAVEVEKVEPLELKG